MKQEEQDVKYRVLVIPEHLNGYSVESVLQHEYEFSDKRISRLKRVDAGVIVNGKQVYMTYRLRSGDILSAMYQDIPLKKVAEPKNFPIDILYEDEYLLILNKPKGIVVHPTKNPEELTLENALAYYLGEKLVGHPVSRLDKGTTGIMTVAKYGYIHEILRRKLHTDDFRREYRGIADGIVEPSSGEITGSIDFAGEASYKRTIVDHGPEARTGYQVLGYYNERTLLRLIPYTGKTHQLRIHMASIGFPLTGDYMYGIENKQAIDRPALHSYELWLKHPVTHESIHITCPIPEDMQNLLL